MSVDDQGNRHDHSAVFYDDGSWKTTDTWRDVDGTVDVYVGWSNSEGDGKSVHTRNGERINDIPEPDPFIITAGEDTGADEATKRDPGTQRTASPAPRARVVRAAARARWTAIGGAASMAASRLPRGPIRGMPTTKARSRSAAVSALAQ
jgi:hypothetical protein